MNKRVFVKKKNGFQVESLGIKSELLENLKENGIPSVAVKCVEIRKNTSGEGDSLDCN